MAAAPGRPQTLTALAGELPPSHTQGVFPRRFVYQGESVLFETRPSFLARYWGRMTAYILLLLLFIAVTTEIPQNPATEFFDGLFIFLILWTFFAWWGSAYALTDRRVLLASGLRSRSFQEMNVDSVHNMTQDGSATGKITFDSGIVRNPSAILSLHRTVKVVWSDLPNTPQVYAFLQDAFSILLAQARRARVRQALFDRAREYMVTCQYCNSLIDVRRVESDPPKCPRCGAPILPAELVAEVSA